MKAVLISIRPEWCQLIAGGQKTVEVRKNRPKLETPFKCYIYCTNANTKDPREVLEIHGADGKIRKANGHVIGEFVCDSCTLLSKAHYGYIRRCAGIRKEALKEYMGIPEGEELSYSDGCFGWHISELVIYDEPKPLSDFKQCHACAYMGVCNDVCWSPLQKPPQSWFYVEG